MVAFENTPSVFDLKLFLMPCFGILCGQVTVESLLAISGGKGKEIEKKEIEIKTLVLAAKNENKN